MADLAFGEDLLPGSPNTFSQLGEPQAPLQASSIRALIPPMGVPHRKPRSLLYFDQMAPKSVF